jgi:hypothetical protein
MRLLSRSTSRGIVARNAPPTAQCQLTTLHHIDDQREIDIDVGQTSVFD